MSRCALRVNSVYTVRRDTRRCASSVMWMPTHLRVCSDGPSTIPLSSQKRSTAKQSQAAAVASQDTNRSQNETMELCCVGGEMNLAPRSYLAYSTLYLQVTDPHYQYDKQLCTQLVSTLYSQETKPNVIHTNLYHLYSLFVIFPVDLVRASNRIRYHTQQGCPTYGTRAQNGMLPSLLSHFFSFIFARLASLYCEEHVYVYTSDCVQTVYDLPLLPGNSASAAFVHKSGAVRSVDCTCIFIIVRHPDGDWTNT